MPTATDADLVRMRDQLFFEGPDEGTKTSRFWILLVLAAVIASAGVIGDSTATVIGAMIVAPLMVPILGTMLAVVLVDRRNLLHSLFLVVAGAIAVVAIAYGLGLIVDLPIVAEANGQVSARVSPQLMDLLAALATGAVGSVALVRSDISDTLPGVAIAISLVPPLAVVGLTLEAGEPVQAAGALLLFVTNVTAILASGIVVMWIYRVHKLAPTGPALPAPATGAIDSPPKAIKRSHAVAVIAISVLVVAIPLTLTTTAVSRATVVESQVHRVADEWAGRSGWAIVAVAIRPEGILLQANGPLPAPDPQELRRMADEAGLTDVSLEVDLVPTIRTQLPAD